MPSCHEQQLRKKFPKHIRIKRNYDFREIFKNGKRIRGIYIDIYILKMADEHKKAYGIAVSRKIKGAVNRNKYKRIIREILRNEDIRYETGIKMVVFVKKEHKKPEYGIIRNEILSMLY